MRRIYTNHELCSGCRACSVACNIVHRGTAGHARSAIRIVRDPRAGYEFQAVCRICADPACVAACMAAALSRDPESGRVLLDHDRCVGCWMCVMVCPHQGIHPDPRAHKAILCDQCTEREVPACVAACATGAIAFVNEDEEEEVTETS